MRGSESGPWCGDRGETMNTILGPALIANRISRVVYVSHSYLTGSHKVLFEKELYCQIKNTHK